MIAVNKNVPHTQVRGRDVTELKKSYPPINYLEQKHFNSEDRSKFKADSGKAVWCPYYENEDGMLSLILDKVDFQEKNITEDNSGNFLMIKGSLH
jgi:hypothetical protein